MQRMPLLLGEIGRNGLDRSVIYNKDIGSELGIGKCRVQLLKQRERIGVINRGRLSGHDRTSLVDQRLDEQREVRVRAGWAMTSFLHHSSIEPKKRVPLLASK